MPSTVEGNFRKFSCSISTSSMLRARPRQSTLISHVPKDSSLVLTPRSIIRSLIRGSRWYNICCNFIRTSFHYPCPTRAIHLRFSARSCVPTYRFILEFLRSIRSYSRQRDRHVSRVRVWIPIRFVKLAPKRAIRIVYVSVIIKWRTQRWINDVFSNQRNEIVKWYIIIFIE